MDKGIDLNETRNKIDGYDREIIRLIEKRMDAVHKVAEYKIRNGIDIFDGNRENEVLNKVGSCVENPDHIPFIKEIYKDIMKVSRDYQKKLYDEK